MPICDLNNSAAVRDELLRGHIPLGVIGLPANDFKVRDRLCCDVINRRQQGEAPLVFSALGLRVVVVVRANALDRAWTRRMDQSRYSGEMPR